MQRTAHCTPAAIGFLPIPDPRTWPAGVRERFSELRGNCGPLDISIFVSGTVASLYLQDAVTAAGILEIDPSEWRTEDGYPALQFNSERIGEFSQRLTACGYVVRILEPTQHSERSAGSAARAVIINIASARRRRNIL
jgi:hypothetical protein